ncbi:MAG: putative sulfate exporter family transporter, partial [Brevundimonas mediterranea]
AVRVFGEFHYPSGAQKKATSIFVLKALRNLELLPQAALSPMAAASGLLTVAAMAALGLQTDIRAVARAGGRVVAAVVLSLAALVGLSLGLIAVLGV